MPSVPPRSGEISRRHLLGFTAAGFATAAFAGQAVAAVASTPVISGSSTASLDAFTKPTAETAPRFRWWWPNGEVELDEIALEVKQAAENGFHGLEIANVHHSVPGNLLDVEHRGWGSTQWLAALETALTAGAEHGVEIDLTLGPSWPASVPGITPQDDAALKELSHGTKTLKPGEQFIGALPEPDTAPASAVTSRTLIGVQAFELLERPAKGSAKVRHASVIDLTSKTSGETLEWTAPETGKEWVLLAYWQRGSGQEPEGGPHTSPVSYVVDHFSARGAQAVIDYWEANVLSSHIKDLLTQTGGAIFEDSLEIETKSTIWTPDIPAEFRTRIGYDLIPFLPVLVQTKEKYLYDFDDIVTTRVRDDFNQVVSDLYSEYHLTKLRDWAHTLDMKYRVQAYGLAQDSLQQAGIVDIPETESLGAKNLDDYRFLASGRDIAGHTLLSCESAAYLNKAYISTWSGDVLQTLGGMYCGGVNQTVMHGFSYATAPGAKWPGFAAFTPYKNWTAVGYSESWGPRMPAWKHMGAAADFIARTQWVLRQGRPRYDVAFFRQKGWAQTGIGSPWGTNQGVPTGWTQGFLDETSLFQELAVMDAGRFAPEGGSYQAFVIDIDRFRANEATMSKRAAARLLELAQQGLRLVFFGDWSAPQSTGLRDASTNAEVASLVSQLKNLPTTKLAPTDADIPTALAALGVTPTVRYDTSMLKHVHRRAKGVEFHYFVNAKHNAAKDKLVDIDQHVTITRSSDAQVPYVLNAWDGTITPLAAYAVNGLDISVRVRLRPSQSMIVALAAPGWADTTAPKVRVQSTKADDASVEANGSVFLHSTTPGTLEATLGNGTTKRVTIPALPASIELDAWQLTVGDWQPVSPDSMETQKIDHQLTLSALAPWSTLGGLEDVSGIGTYTSTFTLDDSWRVGRGGVKLSLGRVVDTFNVWINGMLVTDRDFTNPVLDISNYARTGRNTIRVEVASTLINRMRTVVPEVYGVVGRQEYGLLGPVTISAYGKARIA